MFCSSPLKLVSKFEILVLLGNKFVSAATMKFQDINFGAFRQIVCLLKKEKWAQH